MQPLPQSGVRIRIDGPVDRSRPPQRSLELQPLEERRLRTVTVAEAYPGFYEVTGDDSPNDIAISVSMAAQSFTLDGATYSDVTYIAIQGFGGSDNITVRSEDGSGSIAAGVDAGDGNDDVSINFDGAVWAGGGNDRVELTDSFRGEVFGEGGGDDIAIAGACVDAQIDGGDGNDRIDCSRNLCGVVVHGGAGNDTITGSPFDDQIYGDEGNDSMIGGAGSDAFYVTDPGDKAVDADASDTVYIGGGFNGVSEPPSDVTWH